MKALPRWMPLVWIVLACAALASLALGQTPDATPPQLDIGLPAGGLAQALDQLSQQTGLQILYDPEVVRGRFATQVEGRMTAMEALQRLLAPTDVTYQVTGAEAVALLAVPAAALPEVRITGHEPRFVAPTNRDRIGRIWAPVKINGRGPFRLVLDTGASRSALVARTARLLGTPLESAPARLYGVTGTAVVPTVHVDAMEVGDFLINTDSVPVVADVFGGADGVLGRDGLRNKRMMADFQHDRLVISLSHKEHAPPGYKVVHLKLTGMGLLAADTQIGGVPAIAIIDTGAQVTIGNLALRDALLRRPPTVQSTDVVGVTLDVQEGQALPAPPIYLDEIRVRGTHVTFGDMSLFEHWHLTQKPTLLIGMDVLGLLDVLIIDYELREMQVRLHDAYERTPLDSMG
jgi:predicted aspartyl protease